MATLSQIQQRLLAHKTEVAQRFKVRALAVFGSYAREDQTEESDVDILVEFAEPVGVEFIDLGNYLEKILGMRVDLVSRNGIKPQYFKQIEGDLKYV